MKYLYNPATDSFEALEPTLRERFALGSKDPAPEVKTDGEVAGALMDAFPKQSFLQYQNAVDDGFQGTFEEFLQINSLDKSELDMKAIEGQLASGSLLKAILKTSEDVAEQIAKTKTTKRDPGISMLRKKDPKNYTEAEKLKERDLTEKIITAANNPLYKDLFPKKVKNIKSITDLSQSELDEISKNFLDFQFKPITDEKGLGPYSTLKFKGQKSSIRTLFKAREDAKKRPDFFSLDIAGDTFNLPYMKGIDPKTVKNFEKVYPTLKKIESNPTVENYYKQISNKKTGERFLLNDIQAYLTGVDTRSRSVFDSSKQIQFLKSLDLENKLSEETIELLKTQKGKDAANRFKQPKATKEATKVNLAKVNTESIQRINEIYSADPDATAKEVIDQYYGTSIKNKSKTEQAQMLKELRNDVITYYKIGAKTRKSVKGVRLPSKEKVDNILTSIMEGKGKDSFDIHGGYLRNIYSDIADSVTKPGFKYDKKISALSKQFPGQHVDHSVGLSAVHEVAPGYVEAVQIISKNVNQKKGRLLDRAATGIIDDFFTNTPNKLRKIGDKEYKTFEEKVNAFNNLSTQFKNANNIDTPLLRFGEPGKGPSPKETVEYFSEFSKGAQKNMMEVWNNHGFVVYTNSRPMQSSYWKTLKDDIVSKREIKNMGGLISRVNFSEGTNLDQFFKQIGVDSSSATLDPENMAKVKELLSGLNNTEVMDNALKNNAPSLEESMFGTKEESNLLQRLNQTLDPRAFPYYAAQLTKGLALAPEVAGRFTLAVPQFVGDVAQGKAFSKAGAETIAKLDPKFTQEKVIEGSGLQKIIDDMDKDITGSQRSVGQILKMGGESLGPATGVGYFLSAGKAANQIRKELQKYTGTASAAKELEKSVEEKASSLQMTRREFNSLLAGGGIIGLVKALGLDTIFPAAKTVAQKAAPEIITKGGTPKYFFDFVNLIKSKGDDITETAATVERQKVYDYNGYTMYEDMTTGKISIRKDTEGGATYSIGDGEYETVDGIIRKEEINYEPSETILNEKGKPVKVPDQYDEATVRPDEDGGEGDFEAGLDSIEDILELLSKDGKTYSKEELLKMGIDADALGNYPTGAGSIPEGSAGDANPFKPKKAGGGIIKLAGDDSGPPPKSGPTPHGLPYIAKNVRPIKERK